MLKELKVLKISKKGAYEIVGNAMFYYDGADVATVTRLSDYDVSELSLSWSTDTEDYFDMFYRLNLLNEFFNLLKEDYFDKGEESLEFLEDYFEEEELKQIMDFIKKEE